MTFVPTRQMPTNFLNFSYSHYSFVTLAMTLPPVFALPSSATIGVATRRGPVSSTTIRVLRCCYNRHWRSNYDWNVEYVFLMQPFSTRRNYINKWTRDGYPLPGASPLAASVTQLFTTFQVGGKATWILAFILYSCKDISYHFLYIFIFIILRGLRSLIKLTNLFTTWDFNFVILLSLFKYRSWSRREKILTEKWRYKDAIFIKHLIFHRASTLSTWTIEKLNMYDLLALYFF